MPRRARYTLLLPLLVAALTLVLVATPAGAQELAPTWDQEISQSQSDLRGKQTQLEEDQKELAEAEAQPGGPQNAYAKNRRERVQKAEERVATAEAYVTAAQAGQAKEEELYAAGEPQDDAADVKEAIEYHEVLRDEANAAGAGAAAQDATEELEGGPFGGGLYADLKKAEKVRAAKEAVTPEEETSEETTTETTEEEPAAGGENQQVEEQPEPTPEAAPEEAPEEAAQDEAPAGAGPGIGGFLGALGITRPLPVLVFFALVIGCVFALAKSGAMSIGQYFSLPKSGAMLASVKTKKEPAPKPSKKPKPEKAATKPATSSKPANLEDEPEKREGKDGPARPKPGPEKDEDEGMSAEELDRLFDLDKEPPGDEEPPD